MPRSLFLLPLLFLAGCGQAPGPTPDGKPSPGKEGLTWTHKELLDYLKDKGVTWEAQDAAPRSPLGGPLVVLFRNADEDGNTRGLQIVLAESPPAARDAAGAMGGSGFAWGRFLFFVVQHEPGDLFDEVRQSLQ